MENRGERERGREGERQGARVREGERGREREGEREGEREYGKCSIHMNIIVPEINRN